MIYIAILVLLWLPCFGVTTHDVLPSDSAKARYVYYEAMRLKGEGRKNDVFDLLQHALALDSTFAAAYSEIAPYYFQLQVPEKGYNSLLQAVKYDPTNYWYIFSAAEVARQVRDYDTAQKMYADMLAGKPAEIDIIDRYAEVCLQKGEPQKALDAYSDFELHYGATETTILQKARIYLIMQQKERTYEEMERLIVSQPRNTSYVLLLGNLYLDAQRYDDAWNTYMRAQAVDPESISLQMALLDYYTRRNDRNAYKNQLDAIIHHTDVSLSAKISVLSNVLEMIPDDKEYINSKFFEMCEMYPGEHDLHKLYGATMMLLGDTLVACRHYEVAIDIFFDEETMYELLDVYSKNNDYEAIYTLARRAIGDTPTKGRYYLIAASAQMLQGNYSSAEETLAICDSIPEIYSDPLFRAEKYSMLGNIRYLQQMYDEAFTFYEQALKLNPKDYELLNNYSYYLALQGRDLDKAERMSGETIKAFPDNATYLDTYAWIYFKQQRYSLARIYIKKALDNATEISAEMYEHYGDILAVIGQIDEAVEWWEKADDVGGGSEILRQKIAHKKYIAE